MKKEDIKSSPFADYMIIWIELPKFTKNLRIYEFSKDAGYKTNRQKWTALLYTNNEHMETVIRHTINTIDIFSKVNEDLAKNRYKICVWKSPNIKTWTLEETCLCIEWRTQHSEDASPPPSFGL